MTLPAWTLRRWCPESTLHQDPDEPVCLSEHDDGTGAAPRTGHRLRVRRMLVCPTCGQAYLDREAYQGHECHSAY